MIIIPAIDIRRGNCVRLVQGDPERETVYSNDPVKQALEFQKAGAELIHVVDLDGAFSGSPVNREIVAAIAQVVDVPIEIGGGIRTGESIEFYRSAGIGRVILGTAILAPEFSDIVKEFASCLVAGIDARNAMVAVRGWKEVSTVKAADVIADVMSRGIKDIIYTDITTDGMLTGPNYAALGEILSTPGDLRLVASGGVSSEDDIHRLNALSSGRLWGCIVGKAIYDGRINLKTAIEGLRAG